MIHIDEGCDSTPIGNPDVFWNCYNGNIVVSPAKEGLLRSFYQETRISERQIGRVWFFTDEPVHSEDIIAVGVASSGTSFLKELWACKCIAALGMELSIPHMAVACVHLCLPPAQKWTKSMFLTELPTHAALRSAVAEARSSVVPHIPL